MTAVGKIDTHHHFFPRPYVEGVGMDALARVMPNKRAPQWSPDATIAMMDAHGIDEAILSISPVPPQANTPTLLRACNDSAAELRVRYPGRFG
jgi:predicted TIM-barrel fold metal-dependent hydrolase